MVEVSVRGGFSDRNNINPQNKTIQLKEFDKRTRTQFQNVINRLFNYVYSGLDCRIITQKQEFYRFVLSDIYIQTIDVSKNYYEKDIFKLISNTLENGSYDEVLTVLETIVKYWNEYLEENKYDSLAPANYAFGDVDVFEIMNSIFKREYVGYRFINEIIEPITDDIEIKEITEALETEYKDVEIHLEKANAYLSNRNNPDYENSIKESITAIESICSIYTNTTGGKPTLGNLLRELEKKVYIHPALIKAFNSLYGYTNDAKSIRHAGNMDGPNSTFAEAKFMLVACSAFINYLKEVSIEYGKEEKSE